MQTRRIRKLCRVVDVFLLKVCRRRSLGVRRRFRSPCGRSRPLLSEGYAGNRGEPEECGGSDPAAADIRSAARARKDVLEAPLERLAVAHRCQSMNGRALGSELKK